MQITDEYIHNFIRKQDLKLRSKTSAMKANRLAAKLDLPSDAIPNETIEKMKAHDFSWALHESGFYEY